MEADEAVSLHKLEFNNNNNIKILKKDRKDYFYDR